MAMMFAKETIKAFCFIAGHAGALWRIVMCCFTIDLHEVVEALVGAAQRGAETTMVVDGRTARAAVRGGKPHRMKQELDYAMLDGVRVLLQVGGSLKPEYERVGRKVNATEIQHSKCCFLLAPGSRPSEQRSGADPAAGAAPG